jgi:uncharacterized protein involved in type VI secretion and phage assembly
VSNAETHSTGTAVEKISGVVLAVVTNNQDPEKLGRVKLKFPWRDDTDESEWSRIASLMAGNDRGTYFLPEVGDEVLVSFEHGDIQQPIVIGGLWNGKDKPPTTNQNGKNDVRMIKSRSGHIFSLNDESGKETIEIHTKAGHKIILDDSSGSEKIEIIDKTGNNSISIDSNQNSVTLKGGTKISLQASLIEIKADASLDLKGGVVKIN